MSFKITRWSDTNEDFQFVGFGGTIAVKETLAEAREYAQEYSRKYREYEVIVEDPQGWRAGWFIAGADFDLNGKAFLLQSALDPKPMMTAGEMGRKGGAVGGRATTDAKRAASAANGAKGGRPKKKQ